MHFIYCQERQQPVATREEANGYPQSYKTSQSQQMTGEGVGVHFAFAHVAMSLKNSVADSHTWNSSYTRIERIGQ